MLRRSLPWAAVALLSLPVGVAPAQQASSPGCHSDTISARWAPDSRAADAYIATRRGQISWAVRTDRHLWGLRADAIVPSASVLKAMLLVAYLDMPSVRSRPLNGHDYALLVPMITRSDNAAADVVDTIVGDGRLSALARRVGMQRFSPDPTVWGLSQVDASDQTRFFLHIERYIDGHVPFALAQLASIIGPQRWGVGRLRLPKGWRIYFKGGWGAGTGAVDHQVALLTHGCTRLSLAIMTVSDGSHDYGKETLFGVASRLLRTFPPS
jgi:beta-lactamase class A